MSQDRSSFFDKNFQFLSKKLLYRTIFFRPLNAIKKQAVIANGVQRNEAICPVLAGFLLKFGRLLRRASSQ